ncbi:hypothetical protein BT69DRAFT_1260097, partial [Atractiella rhizophila]
MCPFEFHLPQLILECMAVTDHVYLSPPWSTRDSEPYLICRIMEFLEPRGNSYNKARVAYYLRQRDISARARSDGRQVVATMHCDVCPVQFLRKKCYVKHRDELKGGEWEAWKKTEDRFWFSQLYDRYIHRAFDVVPTSRIKNAPPEVLSHLQQSYTFVFVEPPRSSDLLLPSQSCVQCRKWAITAESVCCSLCERAFHLACLDPPMLRKPASGYVWACTGCTKGAGTGDGLRDRVKAKDSGTRKGKVKGSGLEDVGQLKLTNGWPFRYFGEHCDPYSVLVPHDSPHPRASTRFGPKFQAIVPEWSGEPQPVTTSTLGKRQRNENEDDGILCRGTDETSTLLYAGNESNNSRLPDMDHLIALQSYKHVGVALVNKAVQMVQQGSSGPEIITALEKLSVRNNDFSWPEQDLKVFDDAVKAHGDDLGKVVRKMGGKKPGWEVTRYWYVRHGHKYQGDSPSLLEEKKLAAAANDISTTNAAVEEESMCGSPPPEIARGRCLVCETRQSERWYRCPEHIGMKTGGKGENRWMCETCGLHWRCYGNVQPPPPVLPLVAEPALVKKSRASTGRSKNAELKAAPTLTKTREPPPPLPPKVTKQPTPPPPSPKPLPPKPCLICKRLDPKASLYVCTNCGMSVHAGCYGIDDEKDSQEWKCELCGVKEAPVENPSCALCPPMEVTLEDTLSALDCLKPTEWDGFVHLICALWHPQVVFRQTKLMKVAEGCMSVKNRDTICTVCEQSGRGATIACDECSTHAHVGCAWAAGSFRFAFTMKPVKVVRKKKTGIEVSFRGDKGALTPIMLCKSHNAKSKPGRPLHEISTRDQLTKMTALQTYAQHYKQADPSGETFPLLRRSRRVQELVQPALLTVLAPPQMEAEQSAPPTKRRKSATASTSKSTRSRSNSKAPPPTKNIRTKRKTPTRSRRSTVDVVKKEESPPLSMHYQAPPPLSLYPPQHEALWPNRHYYPDPGMGTYYPPPSAVPAVWLAGSYSHARPERPHGASQHQSGTSTKGSPLRSPMQLPPIQEY